MASRPKRQAKKATKYDDEGASTPTLPPAFAQHVQCCVCMHSHHATRTPHPSKQDLAHHSLPYTPHQRSSLHTTTSTTHHTADYEVPSSTAVLPNMRRVYRLLKRRDIKPSLKDTEVHILWPDNGVWYLAEVIEVRE